MRYSFCVVGVIFMWLIVIPVTQENLRKYKFISAIDAQLLDIMDGKTLWVLGLSNLKLLNVQVEFRDGDDEDNFVKKVKEIF
ncbi:hypothetical protein R6Q59_017488 [Mikania micrantha]